MPGLSHLDVVVDQASTGPGWQRGLRPLYPPQALLQGTQHEDAADEGPILLRLELTTDTQRKSLLRLVRFFTGQHKLLALLSPWSYPQLVQHLRHYLLAQWDDGMKKGVLRFYDPRVFRPVVCQLDTPDQQHLLCGACEWHWIDRDGQAAMLTSTQPLSEEWVPPPSDALNLRQHDLDVLSSWHQAELYRSENMLTPKQCGLNSEEALMDKLAQAFQDAETQKLWSQPDRLAYVQQQLIGPNL